MVKEILLKCYYNQEYVEAKTIFEWERKDDINVYFELEDVAIKKCSDNFFHALVKIRKELEPKGIKLLCKGSSRNVYPSAMSFEMGGGLKAYTHYMGKVARMEDLVSIFEECTLEEWATVDEQQEFYQKWINMPREEW